MGLVIGIDIGGSTTKIVGLQDGKVVSLLKVKADDQLTSAYGAFGKFLSVNDLSISDVVQVMLTGVGASYVKDDLYSIPTQKVDEFRAIGFGGQYLSGLDEAIIVSMGTGTAFVKAKGNEAEHLGGTGVGGGTLLGLSYKMLGSRDFETIVKMAEDGDIRHVDLTIGDISVGKVHNMELETTASNFGKLSDMATSADIAIGIINLVFQTIGMFSVFAIRSCDVRDVVLTGNLTLIPQAGEVFGGLERLYNVHFTIPQHAEYATAIGAALAYIKL